MSRETSTKDCPNCNATLERRFDEESNTVVMDCTDCGHSEPANPVRVNYKSPVKGESADSESRKN